MSTEKPTQLGAEEVIANVIGHTEGKGFPEIEALAVGIDIVHGLHVAGYVVIKAEAWDARDGELAAVRRQLTAAKHALRAAADEARCIAVDRDAARESRKNQQFLAFRLRNEVEGLRSALPREAS